MDTSKTYIKMCDQAWEIQILKPANDDKSFYYSETLSTRRGDAITAVCWLPRQDQLQEMFGDYQDCYNMIDRWDADSSLGHDYPNCQSFEQLWLAIVMKEKYQKIWDGEDWVSSK